MSVFDIMHVLTFLSESIQVWYCCGACDGAWYCCVWYCCVWCMRETEGALCIGWFSQRPLCMRHRPRSPSFNSLRFKVNQPMQRGGCYQRCLVWYEGHNAALTLPVHFQNAFFNKDDRHASLKVKNDKLQGFQAPSQCISPNAFFNKSDNSRFKQR